MIKWILNLPAGAKVFIFALAVICIVALVVVGL